MVQSKAWDWTIGANPRWLQPSEESHYLADRWQEKQYRTLLDLGCGLGRHAVFFAKRGFDVSALDLSPEGVRHLDEWKTREGVAVETAVGDMLRLPYEDQAFDCVFSYHVISHTDSVGIRQIIGEIGRVLKPGGEFYLTLCSKDSWPFREAGFPKIDENTIIKTNDSAEKDVPHFYVSLEDIFPLFEGFELLRIRHIDDCYSDAERHNSKHYFILGRHKQETDGAGGA